MSKHRKPKARKRSTEDACPGDLIIRAKTAKLLWAVAHVARAASWAPETEDCGTSVYAALDAALDDLDAHVRSGCA